MNYGGKLKKKFYRPLPTIPGRLHNRHEPKKVRALIFALVMGYFLYMQFTEGGAVLWLLLVSTLAFVDLFLSSKTIFADVTETTVTTKLENGQQATNDSLDKYAIYIKEGIRTPMAATSNSYKYGVSLAHKNKVHIDEKGTSYIQLHPKDNNEPIITIIDNILCPINLKEWVESFQEQIQKPLPIIFASEKIQSDYETGVFKSLEKEKVKR